MILKIFSIKDTATDAFGVPIFNSHTGSMVRSFTDEINRAAEDNPYYKHPDDYMLYELGLFDTDTGAVEPSALVCICRGKDVSTKLMETN